MKSKSTAYLLWFFLGVWGGHKFYLNKIGMGILYLFTFGIFGIGWFIDLFTLGGQVDTYNLLHDRRNGYGANYNNNIVLNVPNDAKNNTDSISDQLHKLHELKEKGILSEEEYNVQKMKVLS